MTTRPRRDTQRAACQRRAGSSLSVELSQNRPTVRIQC